MSRNMISRRVTMRRGSAAYVKANKKYKDSMFRMLFREKEDLLSLYNAINETTYTDARALKVVTLENAVYMSMKNDQAFLMDCELNLYEHQSTLNPNMPLRDLYYVSMEYQKLVSQRSLYSGRLIKIPTPNFIVFYNGVEDVPERVELRLSDAFEKTMERPNLELIVVQLNINVGCNEKIMDACRTLREYTMYVDKVRRYTKEMRLEEAVEKAVNECIEENILREFLVRNRAEAIMISILEYDEEKEKRLLRKEEQEVGMDKVLRLIAAMEADGRGSEVFRLSKDSRFLHEMLEYYQVADQNCVLGFDK